MRARIYQPARTATQSGMARTHKWVLDYVPSEKRELDPLMGWTGSSDTASQVRLTFETLEAALAYAEEKGLEVTVTQPHQRKPNIRPQGYGENFANSRRQVWTH